MTLNLSMSTIAIASGDCVRTARAPSTVDSRSQVAAFSRPVLESLRDSLTSCMWLSDRCSSVTTGSAATASSGSPATPKVTRMAMLISAASLYRPSPPKNAVRTFADRWPPLTAVMTRALFTAHLTKALRITSAVHTVSRLSAPPVFCGTKPDRPWKVSDAAPYDRPTAAALNTRRHGGRGPHPPLEQRGVGNRDDQREERGQQDGDWQLPDTLDVLHQAALFPGLLGHFDRGHRADQEQAEPGQIAAGGGAERR